MSINLLRKIETLAKKLMQSQLKLAVAESCTGGLIAAALTEVPGSSTWFERGFVCYSNAAKEEMLGIRAELIHMNGAVSLPIAEAMAQGALRYSCADVSLAVTGIAGPSGGSIDKPVGLVCFAWAAKEVFPMMSEARYFLPSSRQSIRQESCHYALKKLLTLL